VLRRVEAIDEGVRNLQDAARAQAHVRIFSPYFISRTYILPILTDFLKQYPRVSIEMIARMIFQISSTKGSTLR